MSDIHWARDILILIGALSVLIVVCAPMLSSKISRDEERRELEEKFRHLDKAA